MIYEGDVLEQLRLMPDNHYHCIVTSPPYWRMRDYGFEGQIGLEEVFDCTIVPNIVDNEILRCNECYMCKMREVFEELRRVLRPDGVLWLNMGDNKVHHSVPGGNNPINTRYTRAGEGQKYFPVFVDGLKRKDMVAQPWRMALSLQLMGWWLMRDVVWQKTNTGPSSVKDQPTTCHEFIFLMTKRERYYYDWAAIATKMKDSSIARLLQPNFEKQTGGDDDYGKSGVNANRSSRKTLENLRKKLLAAGDDLSGFLRVNKRDVWTFPSQALKEKHFATFPEELPRICIAAGTSLMGCCGECGKPWNRLEMSTGHKNGREDAHVPGNSSTKSDSTRWAPTSVATNEWEPGCECDVDTVPCRVLDPFLGSGTTMRVALAMNLECDGIEGNPESVEMSRRRIARPFGRAGEKTIKNKNQMGLGL